MGWRDRFYAMISQGEPDDPDELIELILVRGPSGPMTVARLREDGFDARGHDEFNAGTKSTSNYRILVPRREFERANERLKAIL